MKVFIIGGTGLIGSEGAEELINRGHSVSALALPPLPEGAVFPPEMDIEFGSYMELSDDEMCRKMEGFDVFMFAAGIDERVGGPAPVYEMFRKYNITPLERLLDAAKKSGVRQAVVCGSYFSYFSRVWPQYRLYDFHPYIRSRVDQENMVLSSADENFHTAVLQLPYIFEVQPGRKPVWVFLAEQIRGMKKATLYPSGGTAMITAKQAGQCIAGAAENNTGGTAYPAGWYNMTWHELLGIVHRYMGTPDKKIRTLPKWLYKLGMRSIEKKQRAAGIEGGLDMVRFADIMYSKTFIEKDIIETKLGVGPDDIEAAVGASILLSLEILEKKTEVIDMKGE